MYEITRDYVYENGELKLKSKELNPKAYQPLPKAYDPYWIRVNGVQWAIYADGELVCKTVLKREAKQTIAEWEEMDAELGEKHKYELIDIRKKKLKKYKK